MPVPARVIMDRLEAISDELWRRGEHEQRFLVEALIEAANRAGHIAYTWEGVSEEILRAMGAHTALDPNAYSPQTAESLREALDPTPKTGETNVP